MGYCDHRHRCRSHDAPVVATHIRRAVQRLLPVVVHRSFRSIAIPLVARASTSRCCTSRVTLRVASLAFLSSARFPGVCRVQRTRQREPCSNPPARNPYFGDLPCIPRSPSMPTPRCAPHPRDSYTLRVGGDRRSAYDGAGVCRRRAQLRRPLDSRRDRSRRYAGRNAHLQSLTRRAIVPSSAGLPELAVRAYILSTPHGQVATLPLAFCRRRRFAVRTGHCSGAQDRRRLPRFYDLAARSLHSVRGVLVER